MPEQRLLIPELGFAVAVAYGDVIWKSGYPPNVFRSEGSCTLEEVAEVAAPPPGAARWAPRHGVVWAPQASSPLGLRDSEFPSDEQ